MHTSKAHEIRAHTCYLILMEGITLILGKMNALGTSEMNLLSAGKVNTLSFLYVPSYTTRIFSCILQREEIHLKILPLTLLLI